MIRLLIICQLSSLIFGQKIFEEFEKGRNNNYHSKETFRFDTVPDDGSYTILLESVEGSIGVRTHAGAGAEITITRKIRTATEKKARSVGFQNIFAADGNVNNLKELILQNFNSSDGKLLYVSGEIISNDLDQMLISEGYNVKRIVNYKANSVEKFDNKFIEKLKLNMPEITYVYSQNSAISFLNLIKNYQLENLFKNTNLMCIGEKTSAVLNEIKWKKIFLFNPGEEEFLLYKI